MSQPEPPETGPIIERAYLDMKPGGGDAYVALWPEFKTILMSLPGALSARLLRSKDAPDSLVCCMEWESKAAKDVFITDPRLKPWAERFWPNVDKETIVYYDEAG